MTCRFESEVMRWHNGSSSRRDKRPGESTRPAISGDAIMDKERCKKLLKDIVADILFDQLSEEMEILGYSSGAIDDKLNTVALMVAESLLRDGDYTFYEEPDNAVLTPEGWRSI